MASIPGGIRVNGFISPSDSNDTYATHLSTYGKGGHHEVLTLVERDLIPDDRRNEGMLCYVKETESAYQLKGGILNTDWVEFASATYTNIIATPEDVGGVEAGTTFNSDTMTSIFDRLFYPYQYPVFINVSTDMPTDVEVGYTLTGDYTFGWDMTNQSNVTPNSVYITDPTSALLANNLSVTGSQLVTVSPIQNNVMTTSEFILNADNTRAELVTYQIEVKWGYKYYFGESTTLTIDEIELLALRDSFISQELINTDFPFIATPGYKYICHESTLGTLTVFEDALTKFNVPFEPPYILSVLNTYGINQNYKVYRSKNMINGAMTITVK